MLQSLLNSQAVLDGHIRGIHIRIQLNPRLAIVLADSRKARVVCNSIEPGGEPVPVFESAQFPVSLHEAVLAKIHRLIPVPDHAQDEVIYGLFPLANQKVERFRIPFENAFDDLPVIGLHDTKTPVSSKKTKFMRFFLTIQMTGRFYRKILTRYKNLVVWDLGRRFILEVSSLLLNCEIEALPPRGAKQNCSRRRLYGCTAEQNELRRVPAAIDNVREYHFTGRTQCHLFTGRQRGDQEIAALVVTPTKTYHGDCSGGGQLHCPFERVRQGRENLACKLSGFSTDGNSHRSG